MLCFFLVPERVKHITHFFVQIGLDENGVVELDVEIRGSLVDWPSGHIVVVEFVRISIMCKRTPIIRHCSCQITIHSSELKKKKKPKRFMKN